MSHEYSSREVKTHFLLKSLASACLPVRCISALVLAFSQNQQLKHPASSQASSLLSFLDVTLGSYLPSE